MEIAQRTKDLNQLPTDSDPLAGAMRALQKDKFDIREIHGDGNPANKNLI